MSGVNVVRYDAGRAREWDEFVARAKNGHFLFRRGYMDYHADRFPDASLMFYDGAGRLVALLPATPRDEGRTLASHAGLTFGGVVSSDSMKAALMLELFDAMREHLRAAGCARLVYKAVPHIYHRAPAEEDLYALFRAGARLSRRDLSSAIEMNSRLPLSKGRKYSIKLAERSGVEVSESTDFETFMAIEERVLAERHGVRPVHTAAELSMLAGRFPENIRLYAARREGRMLAGVVVYATERVAHAQYISATEEGRETGATDLIISALLDDHYAAKKFFDFGISTERAGTHLNEGLAENKQGYGARAVVYDFYELEL
jgi:hypothetical protein